MTRTYDFKPHPMKSKSKDSGKLRIGDDWNAIRVNGISNCNGHASYFPIA
jgi:hypothetical protein